MKLSYQPLGHNISCVDSFYCRPKLDAYYLIRQGKEAAIIDSGTSHSAQLINPLLQAHDLLPEQVKYIIPTHAHLDHAGGCGELMAQLPNAILYAHPAGAQHLVDPEKIIAGTIAVYGESEFNKHYGKIRPIPGHRVRESNDGMQLMLEDRELTLLHTPGHARHHLCVWDPQSNGFFTGDTFGIAYAELSSTLERFILLPSTPIDFNPAAWHESLDRLVAFNPEQMYLTHFGRVSDPASLADTLHKQVDAYTSIALNSPIKDRAIKIETQLMAYHTEQLQKHNPNTSNKTIHQFLGMDIKLCAQGLEIWLNRREKSTQ